MRSYDIPDPFVEFVSNKYKNAKGYIFDFFAAEWHFKCINCPEVIYAPNKKALNKSRMYHTRNICLGGY
jgi:hypothetical protein